MDDEQLAVAERVERCPDGTLAVAMPVHMSPYLHNLIQSREPASEVIARCTLHPEEAFYQSRFNGRTPLHEACICSASLASIRALLVARPGAAATADNYGNTPLHCLIMRIRESHPEETQIARGILQIDTLLITEMTNRDSNTPLHLACERQNASPELVSLLLQANRKCAALRNARGRTPLSIYAAAGGSSEDVVKLLIQAYPEGVTVSDDSGSSPLHHAAVYVRVNVVRLLLDNARYTTQKNKDGETPLHIACVYRESGDEQRTHQLRTVQLLLDADPRMLDVLDSNYSRNPLHYACRNNLCLDIVQSLLKVEPRSASFPDRYGYLPLHWACHAGAPQEVIAALLEAYPAGASAVTKKFDAPLHLACDTNVSPGTVKLLIASNKGALVKRNHYGFTPLHCICRTYEPRLDIVQEILDSCSECIAIPTNGGETPLHLAFNARASLLVVKALTLASKKGSLMANKSGNTPLHEACFRSAPFSHIAALISSRPDWIAVTNNAGYTALHLACKRGLAEGRIVSRMAQVGGPDIFAVVDRSGHTPLHSAAREGTTAEVLRSLMDANPEVLRMRTDYGDTPLHLAIIRQASLDCIRLLAEANKGEQLLAPDKTGKTPLGIAMDKFASICSGMSASNQCCVTREYTDSEEERYDLVSMLVDIAHASFEEKPACLLHTCLHLQQRAVYVVPSFMRRVMHLHPEQVFEKDGSGHLPLHMEAQIRVLDLQVPPATPVGTGCRNEKCRHGACHQRIEVLKDLLEQFPSAASEVSPAGEFPLAAMIRQKRKWNDGVKIVLEACPEAVQCCPGLSDQLLPYVFAKVGRDCKPTTVFELFKSRPEVVDDGNN